MTTGPLAPPADATQLGAWRSAGLVLAGVIAAVLLGLHQTFWSMVEIWWRSDTFSHAFLIAPISLYLIWGERARLARQRPQAEPLAPVLVLGFALLWLVAHFIGVAAAEQFAAVLILQASVLAVIGRRAFMTILFPLAYLLLMVPFGEFLVPPLQDITAAFVVTALRLVGIPVFSDGVFLQTPTGNFEVAEACAGLRFLIATVALALLFAYLAYRQWWRRIVFMALALVIPVIANGFRAFGIVLIAYLTDNQVAVDVDHIVYGWIFLTIVTLALLGVGMLLRAKEEPPAPALPEIDPRPVRLGPIALVALAVAAASLATPLVAATLRGEASPALLAAPTPTVAAPWALVEDADGTWQPSFPDAPSARKLAYSDGRHTVELFIAYYPWQAQGAEVVNPNNKIAPEPDWMRVGDQSLTVAIDGAPVTVTATRFNHVDRHRLLVLHWYWVAGEMTGGAMKAKLLELLGLVSGRPAAAAIAVATEDDMEGGAVETLRRFLDSVDGLGASLDAAGS